MQATLVARARISLLASDAIGATRRDAHGDHGRNRRAAGRISPRPLQSRATISDSARLTVSGADEICRVITDYAYPGAGCKQWRAFLSVTKGPADTPLNAIDRVGEGPWYDRLGRVLAMNKAGLQQTRPQGADPAIINDFPNEDGVPNHAPDGNGMQVDNHDFLTGSDAIVFYE